MSLRRGAADERAPAGLRDQRALPLAAAKLYHRQLPRRARMGALRALWRQSPRVWHAACRPKVRRRAVPAAAVRLRALPHRVLPQQRGGPWPMPLVLPLPERAIPVPRLGRGIPRVRRLRRLGHSRGHPGQRARGPGLCDGGPGAADGADQDLRPLHRHWPCALPSGQAPGGRRYPGHAFPEREVPLPRPGGPTVSAGGRVVLK
mmetsp:Transcript_80466/g.236673  ORF Transcript_80466/g.236673 Transcript_80466/m.236673 type:complete len:204 (+) Transcript_80466:114-725(+)